MASPLHRHQSSLETIINFFSEQPLGTELRSNASRRFYNICDYFDIDIPQKDFNRPRLIRYTYTYSLSRESGDYFLRAFFEALNLQIEKDEPINFEDIRSHFFDFADYLFNNFFLPVKASTKKTPQPSPALHSAVQEAQGQGGQQYVGSGPRLSILRRDCLIRDRHRCVISRKFDLAEAQRRHNPDGARDDDGNLLRNDPNGYPEFLEVAHILPHSLTKLNPGGELDHSKQSALAILNMFDVGAAELIQGPEIDRPRNALTLTVNQHRLFGDFQVYFEPVPGQEHAYIIKTFDDGFLAQGAGFPFTRQLYLTPDRTIEPPSPRLLALHRAIAHILHLSAAGDYIDKIYWDIEEQGVKADGSTPLEWFISLAMSSKRFLLRT